MELLPLDNDYEAEFELTRRNTSTGADEPDTGRTGLTVRLSATDGGATIHASLSKTIAERAGTPGRYFARLEGDDLRTQLATSYIGVVVYKVFGDGTNILTSTPMRVVERRRI